MRQLAAAGARRLGLSSCFEDADFDLPDEYLGEGYATPAEPEREAIRLLAGAEGILVDPVYTGRALSGMIDMVRRGIINASETVCFWHTGGTAGIFAWTEWLASG